jgi:hypothetical protein
MTDPVRLPDLPLMLAGVPQPVADLLREAGVPAEPLPEIPLLAAGTGRIVLFDANSRRSVTRARKASAQGLKPINVRELAGIPRDLDAGEPASSAGTPALFLDQLKTAVEQQRGAWVRLSEYPFPYQSAICVGIEHLSEELAGFADIVDALPGKATHFVSSRLRPDRLACLAHAGTADLGWQVDTSDFESSPRRTLSHWKTRIARFHSANLHPAGLALTANPGTAPGPTQLLSLGLRYSCQEATEVGCHADLPPRASAEPAWIRFGALPLPVHERFLEWVGEYYQSGCPLFLAATTERLDLIQELLRLSSDVGRCSLMWQTSYGRFAEWWSQRRRLKLQVWRTDTGHEIHANLEGSVAEQGSFPWAVDIWRGNHRATLPLRQNELVVPDEGLVYLQSSQRKPAGCTMPGGEAPDSAADRKGQRLPDPFLLWSRFRRKGSPE